MGLWKYTLRINLIIWEDDLNIKQKMKNARSRKNGVWNTTIGIKIKSTRIRREDTGWTNSRKRGLWSLEV